MKLIFLKILFKIIHKVKLINNKLINLNVISSKIHLNKINNKTNSKIYLKCRKKYMMMIGLMKMMVKIITILYKLV